jgi:tetratricopeptide (TPR) repeat protein
MIIDIVNYGRINKQSNQQFVRDFLDKNKNRMNTYKSKISSNPKLGQSYRDILTKYKQYENITEEQLLNMSFIDIRNFYSILTDSKVGTFAQPLSDEQIIMSLWYIFDLNNLKINYDKFINLDEKALKLIGELSIDKLIDANYTDILTKYQEIEKHLKEMEKIINIIKSDKIDDEIILCQGRNEELQKRLIENEKLHNDNIKIINDELVYFISVFKELVENTQKLLPYYKNIGMRNDEYFVYDNLKNMVNVDKMTMTGGIKFKYPDFLNEIRHSMTESEDVNKLLIQYCQKTSTLKSLYTMMYNKVRIYHKLLIDYLLYNLFKLIALNSICGNNPKIVIPRFISQKYLMNVTTVFDTLDKTTKSKYYLIIEYMQHLNYILSQKISEPDKCIDIEKTNCSDLILGIILYQTYQN